MFATIRRTENHIRATSARQRSGRSPKTLLTMRLCKGLQQNGAMRQFGDDFLAESDVTASDGESSSGIVALKVEMFVDFAAAITLWYTLRRLLRLRRKRIFPQSFDLGRQNLDHYLGGIFQFVTSVERQIGIVQSGDGFSIRVEGFGILSNLSVFWVILHLLKPQQSVRKLILRQQTTRFAFH